MRSKPQLDEIAHEEGYEGRIVDRRRSRAWPAPTAASNGAAAAPNAAEAAIEEALAELITRRFSQICRTQ